MICSYVTGFGNSYQRFLQVYIELVSVHTSAFVILFTMIRVVISTEVTVLGLSALGRFLAMLGNDKAGALH
jgi:hypothetical protein